MRCASSTTAALIFSLISTLSKTILIFFPINLNTLIPPIWDTEKVDGSFLLSSLTSDPASAHSTAMWPKWWSHWPPIQLWVKTKGKSWNIKDLPKAKAPYTSLLLSTIILIAIPSCSQREINSKIRRRRTFASISINLSPLAAAMLFSLNLITFQDFIHEYRKS